MNDKVLHIQAFMRETRSDEQEHHKRAIVRLREIEAAIGDPRIGKKGHVFKNTTDRIAAARAVGSLVEEAKAKNVSVAMIKNEMPGTTRLDRYKLAPSTDASEALTRAKNNDLQQNVRGYLAAAAAVAKLTFQDPDNLKIRVLSGTSLWSNPIAGQIEDDPRASHLALELNEMARAIVRRSHLKRILDRARRIPGKWEAITEKLRPSQSVILYPGGFLGSFEHWTEAPPLPSVPLIRCVHSLYHTFVQIEDIGRPDLLTPAEVQQSSVVGREHVCHVELSREIRLSLGPLTSSEDVGPMFESRANVTLWFGDPVSKPHILSPPFSLKPVDDLRHYIPASIFQVRLDGLWHRVATVGSLDEATQDVFRPGDDPKMWSINPLNPKDLPIEHWYFSWSAVTSDYVSHWFDRPLGKANTIVVAPGRGERTDQPVWYARPSAAYLIEDSLVSGGLEVALNQAVVRFSRSLEQREAHWRLEASAAHEERMAAWQQQVEF